MSELFTDCLHVCLLLAIVYALWHRRRHFGSSASGLLLGGFALLLFATVTNCALHNDMLAEDQAAIWKQARDILGYLPGSVLIFLGLLRLQPIPADLKQTLISLEQSRNQFRLAMEGSSSGYWDWQNPETEDSVWFSDRFYLLLGYAPNAFPATVSWFRNAVHPDDTDYVWSAVQAHLYQHAPYDIEYRLRTSSGDFRWYHACGQASWDTAGRPTRMSGSIEDITDRKQYQYAINYLISGVTTQTGHSYLESLICRLSELADTKYALIGLLDIQDPAALDTIAFCTDAQLRETRRLPVERSPIAEVIQQQRPCSFRTRARDRFPDDQLLRELGIESYLGIPLFGTDDSVLGLIILMDPGHATNDIFLIEIAQLFADRAVAEIERIQSESELQIHREHLEDLVEYRTEELNRAVKELESFSYSVSHDLRAPLRAIDGFSEALINDHCDQPGQDACDLLQRIRRNTARMGQLIDDLLILSRVTRHNLGIVPIDLSALSSEVLESLRSDAPPRQVEIHIQPGLQTCGDPGMMRIVMENLFSNAWKYTSKTGEARVSLHTVQQGSESVYVVEDNGAGFDMAHRDKLFEVFQRLHGKQDFEGTVVGLATVKRIIDRHGGKIWADSLPGKGTRFYFSLPEQHAADHQA